MRWTAAKGQCLASQGSTATLLREVCWWPGAPQLSTFMMQLHTRRRRAGVWVCVQGVCLWPRRDLINFHLSTGCESAPHTSRLQG